MTVPSSGPTYLKFEKLRPIRGPKLCFLDRSGPTRALKIKARLNPKPEKVQLEQKYQLQVVSDSVCPIRFLVTPNKKSMKKGLMYKILIDWL